MKQSWQNLSPEARHAIRYFNLILEVYDWEDEEGVEHRLDHGEAVYPHAARSWSNGECKLQASLHTQVGMISLYLQPHWSDGVALGLHFIYQGSPVRILERLTEVQGSLRPGAYFQLAQSLTSACEEILVETSQQDQPTFSTFNS